MMHNSGKETYCEAITYKSGDFGDFFLNDDLRTKKYFLKLKNFLVKFSGAQNILSCTHVIF